MEQDNSPELLQRIEAAIQRPVSAPIGVIDNAQDYTAIHPNMVLRLPGVDYYIQGEAREGRFGIEDHIKSWVKFAFDLNDGSRKIIKLPFFEQFVARVGPFSVRCVRKPDKESRVLDLVHGDRRFMQGHTVRDSLGNNIRVIDFIRGRSVFQAISDLAISHEEYFHHHLPGIMGNLIQSLEGLSSLHARGEQHGDVRNDHLLIDADTGAYRWIDFDFEANYQDFDVWSVGNVLTFVVGMGLHTCRTSGMNLTSGSIERSDAMFFFEYRLANLRKLFGYIPADLNDILMRFSTSTRDFYESVLEIVRDLESVFGKS